MKEPLDTKFLEAGGVHEGGGGGDIKKVFKEDMSEGLRKAQEEAQKETVKEKTYKAVLRCPTKDVYSYIEISMEGTVEEIVMGQIKLLDYYKVKQSKWDKEPKI